MSLDIDIYRFKQSQIKDNITTNDLENAEYIASFRKDYDLREAIYAHCNNVSFEDDSIVPLNLKMIDSYLLSDFANYSIESISKIQDMLSKGMLLYAYINA